MRKYIYTFLILSLGISLKLSGQMYVDLGIQYNRFQFSDPLKLEGNNFTPIPTVGFVFYNTKDHRFRVATEFSLLSRSFKQEFPDYEYTYQFTGSQAVLLAGYRIIDRIELTAGANFASFNNKIDGGDGRLYVLGEGFGSYDLGTTAGLIFHIDDNFAVGARYTHWFLPMLEYTEIGNYGELLPPQTDIHTRTIEVFGRFQFLNGLKR